MINENKLIADFKQQKPQPIYRQYQKVILSGALVTVISQLFLLIGIIFLAVKRLHTNNAFLIIGTLLMVSGFEISIYYGWRMRKHRPWKAVLENTLSLNKKWSLISYMYLMSFLTPILGLYLLNTTINAAIIKLLTDRDHKLN